MSSRPPKIGVLRTLDSLGIRPDLVVGTSMGAVVGALYASGYTGRELDSLAAGWGGAVDIATLAVGALPSDRPPGVPANHWIALSAPREPSVASSMRARPSVGATWCTTNTDEGEPWIT